MGRLFTSRGTALAEWHGIVAEAEFHTATQLPTEIENYLVCLLMRFTERPELAKSVVALDFLDALQSSGRIQTLQLRDVGDKCLLFSGLFPGVAARRRVAIEYFIDLGRSAYHTIANERSVNEIYSDLSTWFFDLRLVLEGLRQLEESQLPALSVNDVHHPLCHKH